MMQTTGARRPAAARGSRNSPNCEGSAPYACCASAGGASRLKMSDTSAEHDTAGTGVLRSAALANNNLLYAARREVERGAGTDHARSDHNNVCRSAHAPL